MHNLAAHFDRRDVSRGGDSVWKQLVVCLFIATTLASFRVRSVSELFAGGGMDAQVMFQALSWVALGFVGLYLFATGRADLRLLRRGPLFWYSCFVALALFSTLYSQSPALTAFRSMQLAVAVVLVISLREHLGSLHLFVIAYIAVNWILVLVGLSGCAGGLSWIRGVDDQYVALGGTVHGPWRFRSAFGHPSQIAVVASIGAIGLAACTSGRRWRVRGPIIAWLILTTILTVSRSGIAGLVGGLAVVAFGRRRMLPCVCTIGVVVPLLMMPDYSREALLRYLARGQSTEELASLTGRISVYDSAVSRIEQAWLTGYGFRAARRALLDEQAPGHGVVHAHNLFLESLTSLGVPGAVLAGMVLLTLAFSIWTILRRYRGVPEVVPVGWELCGMLVPIVAFSVLDSGFAASVSPFVMVFLVVLALTQTILLDGPDVVKERSWRR